MTGSLERKLPRQLQKKWGWMALRGALAILFGIIALVWPGMSLVAMVFAFGAFVLIDGGCALAYAMTGGKSGAGKTWPLVALGVVGLVAGATALVWPGVSSMALLVIIAFWAILRGAFEVAAYFPMRQRTDQAWPMLTSGGVSILFGALILAWPVSGILAIVWVAGIYGLIAGVSLVSLALNLRQSHTSPPPSDRSDRSDTAAAPG